MNSTHSMDRRHFRVAWLCIGALAAWSLLAYLPRVLVFVSALVHRDSFITERDFANYWVAGKLVLAGGPHLLFDFNDYAKVLQAIFRPDYPLHAWSYPPHTLLFVWPLGLLRYEPALVVFVVVSLAFFIAAVFTFRRIYAPRSNGALLTVAVAGFVLIGIETGQNGFLTGGCTLLALAWMRHRPVLAGLALACLTIKPHLGVLIPVLLLVERNWRAAAWAGTFTAGLVGLSIVFFGLANWHAFLTDTVEYQSAVLSHWEGGFLLMMPSPFGSLRTFGFTPEIAFLVQWPLSAVVFAFACWSVRGESDTLRRIFIILCATFLISPYGFNYDLGALTVVAAVLVASGRLQGEPTTMLVSLVAGLPPAIEYLGLARVPIAPVILAAALAAIAARGVRESGRGASPPKDLQHLPQT
jgi:Glycosyltransferase family 87